MSPPSTPIARVNPSPRSQKASPRRSPRIAAMTQPKVNTGKEGGSAKKLFADGGELGNSSPDMGSAGKHVFIIKGGTVNIHYH